FHIAALESLYQKTGLREDDLIMLPTTPTADYARADWLAARLPKRKLYHNCSGKHSALMLTQRALGGPIEDYWKVDSVGQREVLRVVATLSEWPAERVAIGIDGCGVPVFAVPMRHIAAAFKNLACPDGIADPALAEAAAAFVPRFHRHPQMMRGTGDLCTLLNGDENIVAKGGANAAYALALKRERIGISIKLADGAEGVRAFVVRHILEDLGYDNRDTLEKLARMCSGAVVNDNGTEVGTLQWAASAPPLGALRRYL
ncbi:MAG: asparaginase, partial [Clostridiales bacterium]|nr:asparaginase [Clostridiales bacterium]